MRPVDRAMDDPLMAAGFARCPTCGARAYPVDAGWLTTTLVLAAYPAPCGHAEVRVWLVDVERLELV